ncbi:MAG TPA: putative 2OG-Fe(II) oxygenase [Casimicrobiaceae bacterium]|nr:putative 2OG-Fe(II) oxygenase [Casimicrobiaceae bacterium]
MEQHLVLFHTPLSVYDVANVEDMNRELRERLSEEARTTPGMRRSNAGGWHSPADLALRTEPCYRAVMKLIVDHVGATQSKAVAAMGLPPSPWRVAAEAWAMVMHNGDYTIAHEHGDAHWSSTYYVDAGDADLERSPDSGALAVLDPRRGGRPIPGLDPGSTFTIRPRTGMLVVFPGWLQHYVHSYRGTRPRISIACNLTLSPVERDASTSSAPR